MKNKILRVCLAVTVIILAAIACSLPSRQDNPYNFPDLDGVQAGPPAENEPQALMAIPTNTNPPAPTATSTPTATVTASPSPSPTTAPTATIENHYYFNNFDSENEGVLPSSHEDIQYRFADGLLIIELKTTSIFTYAQLIMYSQPLGDSHISGDVSFEGDQTDGVGVFCRSTGSEGTYEYYAFLILKNGTYRIELRQVVDRQSQLLKTLVQGTTDLLSPPDRLMDRFDAVCQGNKLYFFLNGALLEEITTGNELTSGYSGILTMDAEGNQSTTASWEFISISKP